ncbi:cytidine deaminase-like protein [Tuber brumale]|nr:cytidine deaminase-like protein [Tuber brumale]
MLIGICGSLCAGKTEVAKYLEAKHGFTLIQMEEASDSDSSGSCASWTDGEKSYSSSKCLLSYITQNWSKRFVMLGMGSVEPKVLETFLRRPFFLLLSVDAPTLVRWQRYQKRADSSSLELSFESFVQECDTHMYHPDHGIAHLVQKSTLRLLNATNSLESLHQNLAALKLEDESRLRPSWDAYFMQLASLAAHRSNCMKRRVGCVLVREKRVISTGYNGTPRNLVNCNEGGCKRCNSGTEGGVGLMACLCIHAEENALLEAGRERVGDGATLYCDTCPCLTCSIKIVQVGITEVVYSQGYSMDTEFLKLVGSNFENSTLPKRDCCAFRLGVWER